MSATDPGERIVVLLYPGCVLFEINLALELLAAHFIVEVLTPDGHAHFSNQGLPIAAHGSFRECDVRGVRAVLVPGGDPRVLAGAEAGTEDWARDCDDLLNRAAALAKPPVFAAICAGPFLFAKAGRLRGRSFAHGYSREQLEGPLASVFAGSQPVDDPFRNDGEVVTAKPWAFVDFAVEVAVNLGVIERQRAVTVKQYYRGQPQGAIRPLALGLVRNAEGRYLFHRGVDTAKGIVFYRPLGGGIDFGERAETTLAREFREELNAAVSVGALRGFFENIFVYEGRPGHEFVVLYDVSFGDASFGDRAELDIYEAGQVLGKAVWRSLAEIRQENASLFPLGLGDLLH